MGLNIIPKASSKNEWQNTFIHQTTRKLEQCRTRIQLQ